MGRAICRWGRLVLYDVVLIVFGLALVAKGGDLFVGSSIQIGKIFGVPRFVIGGTLVSLATTTPELVVSANASVDGDAGIALGNAVGSCICNIGLIVGTVALLTPVEIEKRDFARRAGWMVLAAVLVITFTWDRTLSRPLSIVLLALSLAYLAWDYMGIRQHRVRALDEGGPADTSGSARVVSFFVFGLVMIVAGSEFLVDSGKSLANALGVSSAVIGLSVVAVGTSLPELVTGVSAARKGVPDLALGNIVGANVLNLSLVVGVSGVLRPLTFDLFTQVYSYSWLAIFFTVVIALVAGSGRFHRGGGLVLLGLYVVYLTGMAFMSMTEQGT